MSEKPLLTVEQLKEFRQATLDAYVSGEHALNKASEPVRALAYEPDGGLIDLTDAAIELATALTKAAKLLEYALHLRMYGEMAPGGTETWRKFDTRNEEFLRSLIDRGHEQGSSRD